ncbi:TrbI/VirB10 family protein [Vibrio sp. THAF190c]|uniref:TrbI/VirB10 family protein n=1 Tax=Vibrio sp. THAF190c TaxID=2587865 RepID=UPI001269330F|nr:TrbI/VirB10 family protein [Vibrio sp. THAF190c]QFT13608.1 Bacterial conjugation TrbI-like protein [Vibrio sp. THAF190c]
MFDKFRARFFEDKDGDFEQGGDINTETTKRNKNLTTLLMTVLVVAVLGVYQYTRPKAVTAAPENPVTFGVIVDKEFTEKDNQSALVQQQQLIAKLRQEMRGLTDSMERLEKDTDERIARAKDETATLVENKVRRETQDKIENLTAKVEQLQSNKPPTQIDKSQEGRGNALHWQGEPEILGQAKLPPRPIPTSHDNPNIDTMSYSDSQERSFTPSQFDSTDFVWTQDIASMKRTTDNYVPTGTFVTAIVTGGADANAGVLGQGDTTPVVLQTINEGILPNGKKSKLKDCTVTGATYGEISSSRGIVRTNRMSCILDNDEVLDVAVKGTVFNFGRNGIRGTTILKNGQVVQMAGLSGILTGLGEAGKGLSETTSTSALGSTSSVSGEDIGLNLLGNATASVGAKLADYYIGLAEMYHPIVEINPGAIVNIVFLEGFPLDPMAAEEYEKAQAETEESQSNQVMEVINHVTQNPLANQISAQGIQVPSSPFGHQ